MKGERDGGWGATEVPVRTQTGDVVVRVSRLRVTSLPALANLLVRRHPCPDLTHDFNRKRKKTNADTDALFLKTKTWLLKWCFIPLFCKILSYQTTNCSVALLNHCFASCPTAEREPVSRNRVTNVTAPSRSLKIYSLWKQGKLFSGERDVAAADFYKCSFSTFKRYKENSSRLRCVGVEAQTSETDDSKPGQ